MSISRISPPLTSILVLMHVVACADADDLGGQSDLDTGEVAQQIILGTPTFERPEVGKLTHNGMCTATVVHPSYLITAAHCVDGHIGPLNPMGTFEMTYRDGSPIGYQRLDYAYSLNDGAMGPTDLAMLHVYTHDTIDEVDPAGFAGAAPSIGQTVTMLGYGCTGLVPDYYVGHKQYRTYVYSGAYTHISCKGDSGGPWILNTLTGNGRIWGVTSGMTGGTDMIDVRADAVTHGRPLARGVIALGGSYHENQALASFPTWATRTNVKAVAGDFNADGTADLALVGYSSWTSIPVAFGDGSGGFTVQNRTVSQFPALAAQARNVVAADFDGDGDTDLALTGKSTWASIPMALSNRDGTFTFKNEPMSTFPGLSAASGAYALAGDFDGDGDGDIALLGGSGLTSIPLALSNRNGTFSFQNQTVATFPALSRTSRAVGVAGDFDKDGDTDLALTGASGWTSIPVAFSNRTGGFTTTNNAVDNFPGWAATSGRKIVAGDFDGDQDTDIAVVGPSGWRTIAMALSSGGGYFLPANLPINDIPRWATDARFALAGKVNYSSPGAANWDLILLGGSGWTTVPIAMLTPSG